MGLYVSITLSLIRVIKIMNGFGYENIQKINGFSTEFLIKKLNGFRNKLWNEFIYGGHLVSLLAPSLAFVTMMLFNMALAWEFLLISYLGTYCIYNYDHYRGINVDDHTNSERSDHIRKNLKQRYAFLIGCSAFFFAILFIYGNILSILFGSFLFVSGILYADIFKKYTEKIVGFKNLYTSLSLSLLIIFTALYCNYIISWTFIVFLVFVFLHFIVDTSFCDIKDMKSDKKENLKTLPIYFGKYKFLTFLNILNIISFIILFIAILINSIQPIAITLLVFCLYRIYYINKAKKSNANIQHLSSVVVDAEYFFWPFVILLGNFFIPHI